MGGRFQFDQLTSRRVLLKLGGVIALAIVGTIAKFFSGRWLEDHVSDPPDLVALEVSPPPVGSSYTQVLSNPLLAAVPPTPTSPLDVRPPEDVPTLLPSGAPPGDRNLRLQHTISFVNRGTNAQNNLTGSLEVHMASQGFELEVSVVNSENPMTPQEFSLLESRVALYGKHYTFQLNYLPVGKQRDIGVFANAPAWAIRIDGHSDHIDFSYPNTPASLQG